jgi:hypothetical protein
MFKKRFTEIAVAVAMTMSAGAAQAVQVQVNGGFESGDFSDWTQFPTGSGQQTVTNVNCSAGTYCGSINNDVAFSNSLFKQANVGIGVVAPNSTYMVTFDARGSYATPGGVAFAEFFSELSTGGTSKAEILGGAPLAINADPNVWTSFSFTGTTGSDVSGGVTLQLGATNGDGTPTTMFYDNIVIDVTAVPVPGRPGRRGQEKEESGLKIEKFFS